MATADRFRSLFDLLIEYLICRVRFRATGAKVEVDEDIARFEPVMNTRYQLSVGWGVSGDDAALAQNAIDWLWKESDNVPFISAERAMEPQLLATLLFAAFARRSLFDVSFPAEFCRRVLSLKGPFRSRLLLVLEDLQLDEPALMQCHIEFRGLANPPHEFLSLSAIGERTAQMGIRFNEFQEGFLCQFKTVMSRQKPAKVGRKVEQMSPDRLDQVHDGFLLDLSLQAGPFFVPSRELRFKASNRISQSGRRVLSFINRRFNPYHTRILRGGRGDGSLAPSPT
jgi:hypothetical protein